MKAQSDICLTVKYRLPQKIRINTCENIQITKNLQVYFLQLFSEVIAIIMNLREWTINPARRQRTFRELFYFSGHWWRVKTLREIITKWVKTTCLLLIGLARHILEIHTADFRKHFKPLVSKAKHSPKSSPRPHFWALLLKGSPRQAYLKKC